MDERLAEVERQKQQALNQSNNMYQGLLSDNDSLYKQQQDYANQQEKLQNQMLDRQLEFQQQNIDRQKEEANKNFQAEQKRSRNDYTSFINPYGVNAEAQASQGLGQSGYSETVKLGGWNTYQNRLANANKAMQDAIVQYDNDMNEARLNFDVQKAQNARDKLAQMLEFTQNYYNNKSSISQNQLSNNQNLDSDYFNRYQSVQDQLNYEEQQREAVRQWEAELAEQQRKYNEQMEYQRERDRIADEQWQKELEYQKERDRIADQQWQQQYNLSKQKSYSSSGSSSSNGSSGGYALSNSSNSNSVNASSNKNSSSPTTINGSQIVQGPYQTLSSFIGSTGNVGGDGKTNIDNEQVYPTTDGKFYVYDKASGNYVDISSLKKTKTSTQSSNSSNNHVVNGSTGTITDHSFWGELYKNTLGRFF